MIFKNILLILFCIVFIKLIVYPLRRSNRMFECSQTVNALIVRIEKRETYDYEEGRAVVSYHPVYKYEFGGNVFFKTSYKHARSSHIGKTVKIRINPQNPEEIYEPLSFLGYSGTISFTLFMLLLAIAGLLVFVSVVLK